MKKYMFNAAVIIETENDLEVWMLTGEGDDRHRELVYKKSVPSIHGDRVKELLRRWYGYDQKEILELKDNFPAASGRSAGVNDLKRPLGVANK